MTAAGRPDPAQEPEGQPADGSGDAGGAGDGRRTGLPRHDWRDGQLWLRTALALALGAAGGALFWLTGMPLAWMLGAMCASMAAAVAGIAVPVHSMARGPMAALLGVMLGSAFTPELLGRLDEWLGGFVLVALFVPLCMAAMTFYFRVLRRYDPVTAFFSATPGGITEMILVGSAYGGDVRRISLVHATRIMVVVFVIPFYFRFGAQLDVPSLLPTPPVGQVAAGDWALLAGCILIGWPLAAAVRLPAAVLTGPLVLSAGIHLAGLTQATPPAVLVAAAQVVLGAAIGSRFHGYRWRELAHTLKEAVGATLLLLALTVAAAFAAAPLIGLPAAVVALSIAPGGLAEMALVALALDTDTAYVTTMHIWRIVLVIVAAPLFWRLSHRR